VFASPEARSVHGSVSPTSAVPSVNLPPPLQSTHIELSLPSLPRLDRESPSTSLETVNVNVNDDNGPKGSHPTSDTGSRVVVVPTVVPTVNISRPLPRPNSSTTFHPASKPLVAPNANADTHFVSHTNKTPNVYINGLPPYYPEEQLYALTAPFGGVLSVRSFTRHVGDKCS
jgi:hypothetical protein